MRIDDYKPPRELGEQELAVLTADLKADMDAYLAATPPQVKSRTLADLVAFNKGSPRELVLFGQELFEQGAAAKPLDDPAYVKARTEARRAAGPDGIDKLLAEHQLDALIAPSYGPAWRIDVVTGDHDSGRISSLPAIAGYPHVTVPMGQVRHLPVGLSFVGPAWSEARLLALGHAFEAATHARSPPAYLRSVEETEDVEAAAAPR